MCGITGIISKNDINSQLNSDLYESLLNIQHRGQDACGYIINYKDDIVSLKKNGLVKNAINYNELLKIDGEIAIGHTRYPTTYSKNDNENQPFNKYSKCGINVSIVHNGNLYDYEELKTTLIKKNCVFTSNSDSEIILNLFCNILDNYIFYDESFNYTNLHDNEKFDNMIYKTVHEIINTLKGSFSVILLIKNYGLVCFRDKYGIRPLCYGSNKNNILISSESVCLDILNYTNIEDVNEIILIKKNNVINKYKYNFNLSPCIFEYVYLSRPESVINGVSVYQARINMGYYLSLNIRKQLKDELTNIDSIIPVPDSSLISCTKLAEELKIPLKFGIIKNRYIDRTFIMKNQDDRRNNIKRKLFIVKEEVNNKNIIIVDDSIVRGNTSKHIISELKQNGAKKIYFASCSPEIKYSNKYGIDLPNQKDLIAYNKNINDIEKSLNVDKIIYQNIDDLKKSITNINDKINNFELSIFNGIYIC